jgi:vesicle-fusing ATPase
MADFEHALEEVKPAFGAATEALQLYRVHGMLSCGGAFDLIMNTMRTLVKQVRLCCRVGGKLRVSVYVCVCE